MTEICIVGDETELKLSDAGGSILQFAARRKDGIEPLMREALPGAACSARLSSCFPLVPFGNRLRGNSFEFEGEKYSLSPNTEWDKNYLHGDGWLNRWQIIDRCADCVVLQFTMTESDHTPYRYVAKQNFSLRGRTLITSLSVTNLASHALPYGLGWHPYFPMTSKTLLKASAQYYWREDAQFLPTKRYAIDKNNDYSCARTLPAHWTNTAFDGWNGKAKIYWPERYLCLEIDADPVFSSYFLFVSDNKFNPSFRKDYFCFEPMTHCVDAHHLNLRSLRVLHPGETIGAAIRYTWYDVLDT